GDLDAEFDPEALVPEGKLSGSPFAAEKPLLVLLEGTDIASPAGLDYQFRLTRQLIASPEVARVEGLFATPVPQYATEAATLDELDPSDEVELSLPLLAWIESESERFPDGVASFQALHEERRIVVEALTDLDRIDEVRTLPGVTGRLISEDGTAAVIRILLTPPTGKSVEREPDIAAIEAVIAAESPPGGVSATLLGLPIAERELQRQLARDPFLLIPLSCVASLLVLGIGFRSLRFVLLPFGAAGVTITLVLGTMGLVGLPIDLLSNILPPLLLTISLADGIHLAARFRRERRQGSPTDAAIRTLAAMARACFLTTATTAVGFLSLTISSTPAVRRFGLIAALGVMSAYVIVVLLLPALLAYRSERLETRNAASDPPSWWWLRIASAALRWRGAVFASVALVALASCAALPYITVDAGLLAQFDEDSPIAVSSKVVEDKLGGYRRFDLTIPAPVNRDQLQDLAILEAALAAEDLVLDVDGPAGRIHDSYRHLLRDPDASLPDDRAILDALVALARDTDPEFFGLETADGTASRIRVRARDAGPREFGALFGRIERLLAARGIQGTVHGETATAAQGLGALVDDLLWSLLLASGVIFVWLAVAFRSVRLGLCSIPPNLLPLLVTAAYMALRGIPVHAATVMVYAVSLGLAVDGTIHLLARYQELQSAGHRGTSGILRTFHSSGRAVWLASATLLVGFAALLPSSFVPIRLFAELSAVAIGTSLVAELVLLPALLSVGMASGRHQQS
ncbi:MAG: MMPL family transporter, partial [Myxococcota bacterium]